MKSFGERLRILLEEQNSSDTRLAKTSGVPRSTIRSYFDDPKRVPGADVLFKLASALNMSPSELWMGYNENNKWEDTPEKILERLRLAQPVSIPVFEHYPVYAGNAKDAPLEYVYRPRNTVKGANLEAYRVYGHCLDPEVKNGDIVIIDRSIEAAAGNIILCVVDDDLIIGRLNEESGEYFMKNTNFRINLKDCRAVAVVIEINRRV